MKGSADFAMQTGREAERETFVCLLDLLEREQHYLLSGDVDSLVALSQDKSKAVSELASLADQRSRDLALNFGVLDLSEMIRRFDSSSECAALGRIWTQILDLAAKARALNKVNGALIERRLARNPQRAKCATGK
jgi:flagellar biosynthesis/type III secretory pathway chaperone